MLITSIRDVIACAKHTNNFNKILPHRSKDPMVVALRTQIIEATNFLHPSADMRERLWYIENQTSQAPLCATCGKAPVSWDYTHKQFRPYCSPTCVGNSADVQRQKQHTCLTNNGTLFPAQSDNVKSKYKATMLERHGAPYVNQTGVVISGAIARLSDYTQMYEMTHEEQLSTFDIAEKLGVSQATASKYRTRLGIEPRPSSVSSLQREITSYIKLLYAGHVVTNTRSVIAPVEIDIWIPELRLAFEVDGIYWHSECSGKKDRTYHLTKTVLAAAQNITLIHIFESDWVHRREATQSRIQSLLGKNQKLGARLTTVGLVEPKQAKDFFNQYHIQGNVPAKHVFGLYSNSGTMLACMSFGRSRYNKYQWELLRFCSVPGTTIVGGGGKLFTHFVRTVCPTSVISYSDRRWGTGNTYKKLGFTLSHASPPNYWYFQPPNISLRSRVQFQKHKLRNRLVTFDATLSEWENMKLNHYDRIWDCGNQVWVWSNPAHCL